MGQRRISRLRGAGLVGALAVVAMACSNDGDGGGGIVGAGFNHAPGFNSTVLSIAPAGDGSGDVYVGGDFTRYQSTTIGRIARLNSKGSPA
jgi:hypothetical protein